MSRLITGATDGIGKEYAKELAKQGLNVVLISRTKEKLVAVTAEIENSYKVKTKWIVADFSKGKEIYEHIRQELTGIPVSILVNNVGRMYDYPDELCKQPEDLLWDIININVGAVTLMSRLLIPEMKKQGKGAIVNISSGSELQPMPLMAVYAASKRYIKSLTLAMAQELSEHNIAVQCVTPMFLVTKMNQYSETIMKGNLLIPQVQTFTRSAVFTLGKTVETTGYWSHVITGATDGIGRGYAKELAKRGLNIVLISRSEEKLIATASEIESLYKTKTKWIVADFSKGKEIYKHIKQELLGIPVGILVNNVGRMYDYPDELCNQPEDLLWEIININVGAVTFMSRLVIPEMKKRRKGAIVNISSGTELQPAPLVAAYAATKSYIRSLSLAMECELQEYNITVQCVVPGFVVTKMNEFSESLQESSFFSPPAEAYTRWAVFTLGKTKETTGYWTHAIAYCFIKLFPEWLRIRVGHFLAKQLRAEYLITQAKRKIM
uniref:Inactive hydroxysteroid dehydrogenase-like protein 1 n=1 Tax=Glossina austeni TaxID=7395 RepID=A0A1A9UVE8_GLOAU